MTVTTLDCIEIQILTECLKNMDLINKIRYNMYRIFNNKVNLNYVSNNYWNIKIIAGFLNNNNTQEGNQQLFYRQGDYNQFVEIVRSQLENRPILISSYPMNEINY